MVTPASLLKTLLAVAVILALGAAAGFGIVALNDLFMGGAPSDFLREPGVGR